jgi:hypothetical protein
LIERLSAHEAPVEALFGLAGTPFQVVPFRAACLRFSVFDASSSDADLWHFSVGGLSLMVGLGNAEAVECAILSIYWWETFLPVQHPERTLWEAERAEFDRLYIQERERAIAILGLPTLAGQDKDVDAHQWAIWRGHTGLLVLQESAYDPQFGLDVNYWLVPWQGDDPRPTSPFIDWLFGIQRAARTYLP